MSKIYFKSAAELASRIDAYFTSLEGGLIAKNHVGDDPIKTTAPSTPEPATITGLAFFLGFSSKQTFDNYEREGKFAEALKRGRLRVEAGYEKKLHQPSPTGAIFALKNLGWSEKAESQPQTSASDRRVTLEIVNSGPKLAENEKEITESIA